MSLSSHITEVPLPWNQAHHELKMIRGVCFDVDDTLTTSGQLTSGAFNALWQLKKAQFWVIPITGRPAGWCDHWSRFWPVDAVIGENGAFSFWQKKGVRYRLDTPTKEPASVLKQKLNILAQKIQEKFPQAKWASDQPYREFDLAIDIAEGVVPWSQKEIQNFLNFCQQQEAHAKLSSIHINVWLGEYDKQKGFQYALEQGVLTGEPSTFLPEQWIYIGDSPNDEPLFSFFRYSVGVANLKPYLKSLKSLPTWMTESSSGLGFESMVQRLLEVQNTP